VQKKHFMVILVMSGNLKNINSRPNVLEVLTKDIPKFSTTNLQNRTFLQ